MSGISQQCIKKVPVVMVLQADFCIHVLSDFNFTD